MIFEDSPRVQYTDYFYNSITFPPMEKPKDITDAYKQLLTHLKRAEDPYNDPEGKCDSIYLATLLFHDWYSIDSNFWKLKYKEEIKWSNLHKVFIKVYEKSKEY